ncbi:MAG: NrsF family protein [Acidobacteriota bacterium]
MQFLDQPLDISEEPTERLRKIQTGLTASLQAVRPLPGFPLLLLACGLATVPLVGAGAAVLGTVGWSALSVEQRIVIFASIPTAAVLLAISAIRQIVPGSRHTWPPAALLFAVAGGLFLAMVAAFRIQAESAFVSNSLVFLQGALTYSVPAGVLIWAVLRRGAALTPNLIGATAGALAGLVGFAVREMNCPNLNLLHILASHWSVALIGSVTGTVIAAGRKCLWVSEAR